MPQEDCIVCFILLKEPERQIIKNKENLLPSLVYLLLSEF